MRVDLFPGPPGEAAENLLAVAGAYGGLFDLRIYGPEGEERLARVTLASRPLDAAVYLYGYGGEGMASGRIAVALWGRLALADSEHGPAWRDGYGVWHAPFGSREVLRAVFARALDDAVEELARALAALRRLRPAVTAEEAAAVLEVHEDLLRRARGREAGGACGGSELDGA